MKQFCLLGYEDPEVSIPLFDEGARGKGPYVSVVIGPNGSGKSRGLSRVVDELCYLHSLRTPEQKSWSRLRPQSDKATINYRLDGVHCTIFRTGSDTSCLANGKQTLLSELPFPERVATVSHLPTDKFRFLRSGLSDFYTYLGLRQATNLTTTGALETKVIQSLFVGFTQEGFPQKLRRWLSLAGMTNYVGLTLTLNSADLLAADLQSFNAAALEASTRRTGNVRKTDAGESPQWFVDLDCLWLFFSLLREYKWAQQGVGCSVTVELLPLMLDSDIARLWTEGLEAARRWRLFRETSLVVGKPSGNFRFSELSSGEQQLIGTNARLLAELKPGALVVIDEPEISLHPEWQIKYVPTLLKSLEAIPATHVVIATHSHFMVSDLDRESSALITSSHDEGSKFQLFDGDVYGRSPENILYRVFGVASAGNSYVEGDLYSALRMISKAAPMDQDELGAIYRRLQKVCGNDNTALNIILEQVRGVLEGTA